MRTGIEYNRDGDIICNHVGVLPLVGPDGEQAAVDGGCAVHLYAMMRGMRCRRIITRIIDRIIDRVINRGQGKGQVQWFLRAFEGQCPVRDITVIRIF